MLVNLMSYLPHPTPDLLDPPTGLFPLVSQLFLFQLWTHTRGQGRGKNLKASH